MRLRAACARALPRHRLPDAGSSLAALGALQVEPQRSKDGARVGRTMRGSTATRDHDLRGPRRRAHMELFAVQIMAAAEAGTVHWDRCCRRRPLRYRWSLIDSVFRWTHLPKREWSVHEAQASSGT